MANESEKVIKPKSYKLNSDYVSLGSHDNVKCEIVYREREGFKFFDIVVYIGDRLFLVKSWSMYSVKSLNVYRYMLDNIGLGLLGK